MKNWALYLDGVLKRYSDWIILYTWMILNYMQLQTVN